MQGMSEPRAPNQVCPPSTMVPNKTISNLMIKTPPPLNLQSQGKETHQYVVLWSLMVEKRNNS